MGDMLSYNEFEYAAPELRCPTGAGNILLGSKLWPSGTPKPNREFKYGDRAVSIGLLNVRRDWDIVL